MDSIKDYPVYVSDCTSYDPDLLYVKLKEAFSLLGITNEMISGKKVLLKPNLVLAKKPEHGATTHPMFAEVCARIMHELGAESIVLADSPGGSYNQASLSVVYKTCEMTSVESEHLRLNNDFSFSDAHYDGVRLKNFHVINAACNADVIVDICKLKTHSLTGMSCATKNLFGVIPGVEKFQMHSTFPKINDFSEMLIDLSVYIIKNKTFIAVCDAIISMEGNGPTYGTPKKTGLVLASLSPYALDIIAEHIMRAENTVPYLDAAAKRNLTARKWEDIRVLGEADYPTYALRRPDTDSGQLLRNLSNLMGGRIAHMFEARPKINTKKCIGCGKCAHSCPQHTIVIKTKGKNKCAVIKSNSCIKCYCCQELCPIGAVGTKQNILIKLIH